MAEFEKNPDTANFLLTQIKKKIEKLKKIETINFGFLLSKNYFNNVGSQNYLIFQPIFKTFTMPTSDTNVIIA